MSYHIVSGKRKEFITGECFIFDFVIVLAHLALLALVGGDSDDNGQGDVLVVDIAGGGEGVDSGVIGGG